MAIGALSFGPPIAAGGGGGGAPIDATYVTQTANSTLTNEQALAALATGVLKSTTGTGVLTIAAAGDIPLAAVGPGAATYGGGGNIIESQTLDAQGRTTALTTIAAGGGGGAPTNATYITQTPNATLTAEQALSTLGTGLLRSAAGTGILTIAAAGTDYQAPLVAGTDYEVPLTFANGVTRTTNAIANDLIIGKTTGQTVVGGANASAALTLSSTSHATKGKVNFGSAATSWYNESTDLLVIGGGVLQLDSGGYVRFYRSGASGSSTANVDAGGTTIVTASSTVWKSFTRFSFKKGADVASGGTLTLGFDGNRFNVTGTTTINYIDLTAAGSSWQAGSFVYLRFTGTVTVTHNAGSVPGTAAALDLAGSVNLSAVNGTRLLLLYNGTTWEEIARTVA